MTVVVVESQAILAEDVRIGGNDREFLRDVWER